MSAPERTPMQLAEQLAGLVLAELEQNYFKGWAVLKEDAQRIVNDAMERVRNGTAPLMTPAEVQARLGEHRRDEGVTSEMIRTARRLAMQAQERSVDRDRELAAEREAMADAMVYGTGTLRRRADGYVERVPPESLNNVPGGITHVSPAMLGVGGEVQTATEVEMARRRDTNALQRMQMAGRQWTAEELTALGRVARMEPSPPVRRNR